MFKTLCVIAVAFIRLDDSLATEINCPTGFTYLSAGNTCIKEVNVRGNQSVAQKACMEYNASLVYIRNKEENDQITQLLKATKSCGRHIYWIGGCRTGPNTDTYQGPFVWSTGCTLSGPSPGAKTVNMTYTNWYKLQPDFVGSVEWCVNIDYATNTFSWNDLPCGEIAHGGICETDPQKITTISITITPVG